jgi:hypothetical protein
MVPTLPVLGGGVAGADDAGVDDDAAGLDGVAALPVWASAENVNVAATARRTRRNLLFIGLLNSLEHGSGNELRNPLSDRFFS